MKSLTHDNFAKEIKEAPSVVHFFSAWCRPCFEQEDNLKQLETQYTKIRFMKVNCDENSDLAAEHSIIAVPTIIVFKEGKAARRLAGMQEVDYLKETIGKL